MANPVDRNNLEIYRGSTFAADFNVVDDTGDPFDLSNYSARFVAYASSDKATELVNSDDDASVVVTIEGGSTVHVKLPPATVADWDEPFYELSVISAGGDPYVISHGTIIIYPG